MRVPWVTKIFRGISFDDLELEQKTAIETVRQDPDQSFLLVSEPKATFTHGRTAKKEHLLFSTSELSQRGISIAQVGRGGQWTYHGPGQIVVYPVAHLKSLGYRDRGVHCFLNDLRNSVAKALQTYGIDAEARAKPFGLYVSGKKLVSFGIAAHRNVISHGLAIYKSVQSLPFTGIHPCGMTNEDGAKVISLDELGLRDIEWTLLATQLVEHIKKGFKSTKN
jgi:lipoyl(octanoyl) transferase